MKQSIKTFAFVIALFAIMGAATSCSKSDKLDVEGVNEVTQKAVDGKELTSSDIDFFLDQLEIVVDKRTSMSDEEFEDYLKSLSKEEQDCMNAIVIVAAYAGQSTSKLSDDTWSKSQVERLEKLLDKLYKQEE